jgi:hypothetical protein
LQTENICPAKIDKAIWNHFLDLALADFSELIAPKQIVFCEGTDKGRKCKNFDAEVYEKIFGQKYNKTRFVSIGSCTEIEKIENKSVKIVKAILESTETLKFIDRDDRSDEQIKDLLSNGIKTSKRRNLECYLLDDELIKKLCSTLGKDNLIEECLKAKKEAVENSIEQRKNPRDDIKSASGEIFNKLRKILAFTQCGNNESAFIRDTMAPLVTEDTNVYKELEKEIFE